MLPEDRELKISEIVDASKKNNATLSGWRIQLEELQQWTKDQKKIFDGKLSGK